MPIDDDQMLVETFSARFDDQREVEIQLKERVRSDDDFDIDLFSVNVGMFVKLCLLFERIFLSEFD